MSIMGQVHTENGPRDERANDILVKKLAFSGVFAALAYVAFTFLSIHIPTGVGGQVTVHLGNAVVALGALILGTKFGGVGGAIGLTLSDLMNPVYLPEAPITFLLKFLIGLVVGTIAHHIAHLSKQTDHKKILAWTAISAAAGMLTNAVVDPVARYWYKILIIGKPAAEVTFAINVTVTLINSAVSLVLIVVFYMALRAPLKRMGLWFEI